MTSKFQFATLLLLNPAKLDLASEYGTFGGRDCSFVAASAPAGRL
jgi:hypothetical protein